MFLSELVFSSLRLFSRLEVRPAPGINLFSGENGSGKTSLLEGLYFLSRIRSFRTGRLQEIIRHGSERLQIRATVEESGCRRQLSVEKGRQFTRICSDGQVAGRVSEQALRFPVLAWLPDSARLFTDPPRVRRRWLDWSLFHVKQGFLPAWKRYCRSLRHRNALLRGAPGRSFDFWEKAMCDQAGAIDSLRTEYLEALQTHWREIMPRLGLEASIVYRRGWDEDASLAECLRRQREADCRRGHTLSGPHRADIQFCAPEVAVSSLLSRGQMKRYGVGLILGQLLCMTERVGRVPLVLMDDLDSELDFPGLECVLEGLSQVPAQYFLTTLNPGLAERFSSLRSRVFHMKHGRVEMVQ